MLDDVDILLLQETWLRKGEEHAVKIPSDFVCFSKPAQCTKTRCQAWGGLITLIRRKLPGTIVNEVSTNCVLIIHLPGLFVLNVYLPPDGSPFWSECVIDDIWRAAAFCISHVDCDVAISGDCNSRIGRLLPSWPSSHPLPGHVLYRNSEDVKVNTYGCQLLQFCADYKLVPVNGLSILLPVMCTVSSCAHTSSAMTSFQK